MLPCFSVADLATCNSADLVALQHAAVQTRHLKIGWFRVIKRDGLGDSPPADQHQFFPPIFSKKLSFLLLLSLLLLFDLECKKICGKKK